MEKLLDRSKRRIMVIIKGTLVTAAQLYTQIYGSYFVFRVYHSDEVNSNCQTISNAHSNLPKDDVEAEDQDDRLSSNIFHSGGAPLDHYITMHSRA